MPAYNEMINENAREYLLKIPQWTKKKNTLEEVRDFLKELGNPEEHLQIIHVAGTNGKGSVCADLTAVLGEAGYHTGTFISPHLVDIRERFLLDGEPVPEEAFAKSFDRVLDVVKTMTGRGYCHPTFFEFVFLMAMTLYGEIKPDYVILETGLGGRLDTTNVIQNPLACVITSISLDHTQYLGDTIPQIAAEKAGIIKPGVPVIYDANRCEASEVIQKRAGELNAPSYPVTEKEAYREITFAAPYQAMNAALAVKTLEVLKLPGVDDEVCRRGLLNVCWKGRMQQVLPDIWLDGAHNPGGIEAFIRAVNAQESTKRIQLLFAAVADKDYNGMIQMLCEGLCITRVTVVHLNSSRALDTNILAEQFGRAGCACVEQYDTVGEALQAALEHKSQQDRLYVAGSLYLIGEIEAELEKSKTLTDRCRGAGHEEAVES